MANEPIDSGVSTTPEGPSNKELMAQIESLSKSVSETRFDLQFAVAENARLAQQIAMLEAMIEVNKQDVKFGQEFEEEDDPNEPVTHIHGGDGIHAERTGSEVSLAAVIPYRGPFACRIKDSDTIEVQSGIVYAGKATQYSTTISDVDLSALSDGTAYVWLSAEDDGSDGITVTLGADDDSDDFYQDDAIAYTILARVDIQNGEATECIQSWHGDIYIPRWSDDCGDPVISWEEQ